MTRIQDIFYQFSDQWIQYLWISILYSIEQWNDFGCDLISSNIIIPDGGSSDTACILWSERNLECRYSGRALYTFYDSCIFYQTAKEISLYVKIHQSGILESVRKYNVKNSTSRRNCIV